MKIDSPGSIPDHIKHLMPPADRKAALGPHRLTTDEAVAVADKQSERDLQAQLRGYLAQREIEVLCPATNKRSTIKLGWPDMTFAFHGIPCVWEVKTPIGKLRPEQKELAPKLIANGWRYAVIRSVLDAKKFLDALGN